MTTFYSPFFTDETPTTTVLGVVANPRVKPSAGFHRSRQYYTHAPVDLSGATVIVGDVVRMCSLKSGDRLKNMFLTVRNHASDNGYKIDIGLYKSGSNHDGELIDEDLFTSDLALVTTSTPTSDSALSRLNVMLQSTTVTALDFSKQLWELANLGGASYTVDPQEDWDICITRTTGPGTVTNAGNMLMEIEYLSSLGA